MALPIIGAIIESGAKALTGLLGTVIGDKGARDAAEAEVHRITAQMQLELETTYRAELELQKTVMVAELQHGDAYTKRARPSIVYAGLAVALFDGALRPLVADLSGYFTGEAVILTPSVMPDQFWLAWAGVVGIYAIGRTREKIGSQSGKLLNAVFGTGAK